MKNALLTNDTEPTDKELKALMEQVIQEVKAKALVVKKQLHEKIEQELIIAQERQKAKQI